MEIEYFDNLTQRIADRKMWPSAQAQHSKSEQGVGQSIGNWRFDFLVALRAPITMDRMLNYFGFCFGDILGISNPSFREMFRPATTVRTLSNTMRFLVIDPLGYGSF